MASRPRMRSPDCGISMTNAADLSWYSSSGLRPLPSAIPSIRSSPSRMATASSCATARPNSSCTVGCAMAVPPIPGHPVGDRAASDPGPGSGSLLADDVDRDLHRGDPAPVLQPVGGGSVLRPARAGPVLGGCPVAVVGDGAFEDEDGAGPPPVVVHRAEDAAGLDGHLPHAQLVPVEAVDLPTEVDRGEQLDRDPLGLVGPLLLLAHRALLSRPDAPPLRLHLLAVGKP